MEPSVIFRAGLAEVAAIEVVVPRFATDQSGNSVTARRYIDLFADLGHRSTLVTQPSGRGEVVVALNAYRTASAIRSAATAGSPVIVVLTGTDVYKFLNTHRSVVLDALDRADCLVGLNDRIGLDLEPRHRARLDIIHEGASRPALARSPSSTEFAVVVIGHLREEKDPRTVVAATQNLPSGSRVVVDHYGAAHTDDWAEWARAAQLSNKRYRWHGEVQQGDIHAIYAQSHLLVNSSIIEGGSNVISEAVMSGLAILASDIPGNIGVLGENYPGYFPVGDAVQLQQALLGLEQEPERLAELTSSVVKLQSRLDLAEERAKWGQLFARLGVT